MVFYGNSYIFRQSGDKKYLSLSKIVQISLLPLVVNNHSKITKKHKKELGLFAFDL